MTYIFGPMTGIARWNFPAFFAEELLLLDSGVQHVYNPARVDMEVDHFDPDNPHPRPLKHYAKRDIDGLFACSQARGLIGWQDSKGARAESAVAEWLGIHTALASLPSNEYLAMANETISNIRKSWGVDHDHVHAIQTNGAPSNTILDEAKGLVHGDRGEDYGHPGEDFARTGKIWGAILGIPDVPPAKVAMCMVGVKLSRECNKPKRDNRIDGAGYFETMDMCSED